MKTGKNSLAKHPRERLLRRHFSAQQDYGRTLALVNPIARISWLCYKKGSSYWKMRTNGTAYYMYSQLSRTDTFCVTPRQKSEAVDTNDNYTLPMIHAAQF